ncbi:MAG: FAD-binding oxidoreductase [Desulfobacterales bacterium]|jgi:sarcosine oxidase subunit beta|nr:FAD-binding oxidoreductase [Desulfobacterales bacterium]
MTKSYDAIVVGAGSVGMPTAMALGEKGLRTLVVDMHPSPGQGENKHAIGGVRATHSAPGKILVCLRSLEIFSAWKQRHGDDIEWLQGGYLYPVYREADAQMLKGLLPLQKSYGLTIDFLGPEEIRGILPGIASAGLIGGTFAPKDGSMSPLLVANAYYRRALRLGVEFRFKERIGRLLTAQGRIQGVATDRGRYEAPIVVDAAGPLSAPLCKTAGLHLPVVPDCHEAAITEPVQPFFHCMVVDIRPAPGSKNFYFYQNRHGQVVFCITPDPPIVGTDKRETSVFLPQVCTRLVGLLPRLRHLRVRRTWRGLYPMTPDGSPIVGWNRELEGLVHATGMCGQGLMLGTGVGELVARLVAQSLTAADAIILEEFSPYREFKAAEKLK